MKNPKKLILTAVMSAGLVAAGVAAGAPAANAATSCPTNYLCLYSGTNQTGTMLFMGNGSSMNNSGGYFQSSYLAGGSAVRSSVNNTLGRFCTYSASLVKTNILAAQTGGNLASTNVRYVKIC